MMFHARHAEQSRRRGSVVLIVVWALVLAAIVTSAVQLTSYRQAMLGRESVERVQARWAARGGIEATIAVMADHTTRPVYDDAFALPIDMAAKDVATGEVIGATWDIRHQSRGHDWYGPMDEHSRMNINAISVGELLLLDNMWLDIAIAIAEWKMEDGGIDSAEALSVGREYYLSLDPPYMPRYGPYQNIAELELVAGVWPRYLRGEDWNLNNRLDPNENDGGATFPPDKGDGRLDAGWSQYLTAYSVDGGATATGEPRIYLPDAKIAEVMERMGVEELQARALIRFGRNTENDLIDLLFYPISHINGEGELSGSPYNEDLPILEDWQLRMVFSEFTMDDPLERKPGRINLNTVSQDLFRNLMEDRDVDPFVADEILHLRESQLGGFTSPVDLLEIPEMTDELLKLITERFTTQSNVYTISSRGRSDATGQEVEIIAVVDRSTIPVRIIEYREQ